MSRLSDAVAFRRLGYHASADHVARQDVRKMARLTREDGGAHAAPHQWQDRPMSDYAPAFAHEAALRAPNVILREAHAVSRSGEAAGLVSVKTSEKREESYRPERAAQPRSGYLKSQDAFRQTKADQARRRVARLRMMVGSASRLHLAALERGRRADKVLMLTLTYRNGDSGGVEWSPRHISECMQRIQKWMKHRRLPCRYVWVAELGEKSGRLHYHVALWVPYGTRIPAADRQGWWPHGMTNCVRAKHAVGYLMSYLTKGSKETEFGKYPKGARIYGVGGLNEAARRCRAWLSLPPFLQSRFDATARVGRAVGGGWVDRDTGQWWASEFAAAFEDGTVSFWRVRDYGSSPLVGGVYSLLPGAAPFLPH